MEQDEFIYILKRKKQTIASIMVLCFVLTLIFTLIEPLKYGTESKVLVLQNNTTSFDPYAMSKSSEYLSSLLARVITSNLFFEDVMAANFNIDKTYFPTNSQDRMKKWQKTVSAKILNDSGIIVISVSHENRYQSMQIAQAVNNVLETKHSDFHGAGTQVALKIIDQPITSSFPDKPNFLLNFILSIVIGIVMSLSYVYFFPEERFDLRLLPRKKKKSVYYSGPQTIISTKAESTREFVPKPQVVDDFEPKIDNLFR